MTGSVIVAAVRTPVGRFGSALRSCSAVDLGAVAIAEALARAGMPPGEVDYVLMGQVLQAGTGQITARQAAIAAGVPQHVPAITLNKVCLSSLTAVALADQLIRAGEIEVAIAGGMESMTNAPYVVPGARWGLRTGPAELVDTMVHDGLWSTFTGQHMANPPTMSTPCCRSPGRTRMLGRLAPTSAPRRPGPRGGPPTRSSASRSRAARAR